MCIGCTGYCIKVSLHTVHVYVYRLYCIKVSLHTVHVYVYRLYCIKVSLCIIHVYNNISKFNIRALLQQTKNN